MPVTPVDSGRPVTFVSVPLDGVPRAPPLITKDPADPVFTPKAVTTPVPVVMVDGAKPAPPPTINALAVKTAEDAQLVPLLKYGMPPDVPATVNAGVVVGDAIETIPPVQLTEVTVPPEPVAEMLIDPLPLVIVTPEPAVNVALVNVLPTEFPINN